MIKIIGLNKSYKGTVALKNINLEIRQGEFSIILGPSGAGKSTLLRCINRLEKPDEGQVFFKNLAVDDAKSIEYVRKKTGMIFQHFNLVKRLTVLQNVLCGRLAYNKVLPTCLKLFRREDVDLAISCIERVGLIDKIGHRADQLSGGQQQRVSIARALVQKPDVILADEPIASLDPRSAEQVMDMLQEVNTKDNITMLISLHNIDMAKRYGQRIIGIKNGTIVMDINGKELNDEYFNIIYGSGSMDCYGN